MPLNTPVQQAYPGYTTEELKTLKGVDRELVVNEDTHQIVVLDGATDGGHPVGRADTKLVSKHPALKLNNTDQVILNQSIQFSTDNASFIDPTDQMLTVTTEADGTRKLKLNVGLAWNRETMMLSLLGRDGNVLNTVCLYGAVTKASITSPTDGTNISKTTGCVVTLGMFKSTIKNDKHSKTDWKICTDMFGEYAVDAALNSSDLRTHSFSGTNLEVGKNYYIMARFLGTSGTYGKWSDPIMISIVE